MVHRGADQARGQLGEAKPAPGRRQGCERKSAARYFEVRGVRAAARRKAHQRARRRAMPRERVVFFGS